MTEYCPSPPLHIQLKLRFTVVMVKPNLVVYDDVVSPFAYLAFVIIKVGS